MAVMAALAEIAAGAGTGGVSDIPEEDPNDLEAMDAAWEEAAVRFGPGEAVDGCGTDRVRTQIRAASETHGKHALRACLHATAAAA